VNWKKKMLIKLCWTCDHLNPVSGNTYHCDIEHEKPIDGKCDGYVKVAKKKVN
jgi:hypothetical protein